MQPAVVNEAQDPAKKERNLPEHTNTKDIPYGNEHIDQTTRIPDKPTLERSWEVIMKEVTSLDEGLVGGWKEDIDTLLVFAGLFSAVVTAFTIESYQWLEQAPEDTNVVLLTQIFQRLNNESISPPPQFEALSSAVRINVLWFLSLTIALVDALFALLCKQWLREHGRNTRTRSPAEALALRWLRNQSLEKWRVPTILASLPVLLELALFLFLAGVLELLWIRHRVPFAFAMGVVGFAGLYYIGTAIAPAVNIARQALQVAPGVWAMRFGYSNLAWESPVDFLMRLPPVEISCPYKSPQAWAAFHVFRFISHMLRSIYGGIFRQIIGQRYVPYFPSDSTIRTVAAFTYTLQRLSNWSSVDLELLQRSDIGLAPPFYELNALQWLVEELRDTPIMISHLQNVLQTIPLHLVMPAVLGQPFYLPDREWAVGDIEATLRSRPPDLAHKGRRSQLGLLSSLRSTPLFGHLLHLTHALANVEKVDQMKYKVIISRLEALWDESIHGGLQGIGFPVGLRRIEQLMNDPKSATLGSGLRKLFVQTVQLSSTKEYGLILMRDVGKYIISLYPSDVIANTTTSPTSGPPSFNESDVGLEFLSLMHRTIIEQEVCLSSETRDNVHWMEAMNIVRRVHRLPEDHFPKIPGCLSFGLFSKLKEAFRSLSSADCHTSYEHLGPLKECWRDNEMLWRFGKGAVVMLLADHINNHPQSNNESHPSLDAWTVSPFVMSPSGMELIDFVDKQFEEDPILKRHMIWNKDEKEAWTKAMERVKHAYARALDGTVQIDPEHPEGTRLAFESNPWEDEEFFAARDKGGVDDVDHDNERINPSEPEPSQDLGGVTGVQALNESRDNKEKESMISEPRGSERGQGDHDLGQKEVGGPGADKNV
ncbi:hypothetical protein PQX77_013579 [Marasmius sp. AFHP31]|nr:hypothetical protein PQX77_013579 [Marasmius sp. AFHP31]